MAFSVYLLRHAESTANLDVAHRVSGRSNHVLLTANGEMQAYRLGRRLAAEKAAFRSVYYSPAVRTRQTAEIACAEFGHDLGRIIAEPGLMELCQGAWEGELRSKCYTPENVKLINANPWDFRAPGGGESQRAVEERMLPLLIPSQRNMILMEPSLYSLMAWQ